MTPTGFTPEQLSYLRDQLLGRLATLDEQHAPQVVPVGLLVDEQTGVSVGLRPSNRRWTAVSAKASRDPALRVLLTDADSAVDDANQSYRRRRRHSTSLATSGVGTTVRSRLRSAGVFSRRPSRISCSLQGIGV